MYPKSSMPSSKFTPALNSPQVRCVANFRCLVPLKGRLSPKDIFTSTKRLATTRHENPKVLRWETIPPSQKAARPPLRLRVPTTHPPRAVNVRSPEDEIRSMRCKLAKLRPLSHQSQPPVPQRSLPFSRENLGCTTIYRAPTSQTRSQV